MASKISINLDTSKENYILTKCKQDDDLILEAFIYENGLALDLTNKEIIIKALKADNTYINQSTGITKTNNKMLADLIRDFSRVPGTTKIEILLVEGGKNNTTFSFFLEVVGSVTKGAVESSNTVTILEELDNKVIEAGQVKAETEQLIQSGGAATKGDVAKINSSLEHIENNRGFIWKRKGSIFGKNRWGYEPTVFLDSNPKILTGNSKVLKMWYRDGGHLYYSESLDGLNFEGHGIVLHSSTGCVIWQPFVIKTLQGNYILYAKDSVDANAKIDSWTSSDGINWIKTPTVAIPLGATGEWDSEGLGNLYVWQESNDIWKMIYEAKAPGTQYYLGYATSSDGLNWNKYSDNPVIRSISGGGPDVHKINGEYVMWFHGGMLPTDVYRVRSIDCINWTMDYCNPTFTRETEDEGFMNFEGQISDPTLYEFNGKTYMYYEAVNNQGEGGHMGLMVAVAECPMNILVKTAENYGIQPPHMTQKQVPVMKITDATRYKSIWIPAEQLQLINGTPQLKTILSSNDGIKYWGIPKDDISQIGTSLLLPNCAVLTKNLNNGLSGNLIVKLYWFLPNADSGIVNWKITNSLLSTGEQVDKFTNSVTVSQANVTSKQIKKTPNVFLYDKFDKNNTSISSKILKLCIQRTSTDTINSEVGLIGVELAYKENRWTDEITDPINAETPNLPVITSGLKTWLDGSDFTNNPKTTSWLDRSGNANNVTATGFIYDKTSGSDYNGSVITNSGSRLVLAKGFKSLGITNGDFTLQLRAKISKEIGSWAWLFSCKDNNSAQGLYVGISGGKLRVGLGTWFTDCTPYNSLESLVVGKMYTITVVRKSGVVKVYIDNKDVGNNLVNSYDMSRISDSYIITEFGKDGVEQNNGYNKLLIYNRALSFDEIQNNLSALVW